MVFGGNGLIRKKKRGRLLYYCLHLQDGQQFGDEYLAELDYIEVVERQKEGYESDVDMDEGLGDGSDEEDEVDDSDEEGANLSHNDSDR